MFVPGIAAQAFGIGSRWNLVVYLPETETGGNNSVVECNLAKVEVAGSNPVSRSIPSCLSSEPVPQSPNSMPTAFAVLTSSPRGLTRFIFLMASLRATDLIWPQE